MKGPLRRIVELKRVPAKKKHWRGHFHNYLVLECGHTKWTTAKNFTQVLQKRREGKSKSARCGKCSTV